MNFENETLLIIFVRGTEKGTYISAVFRCKKSANFPDETINKMVTWPLYLLYLFSFFLYDFKPVLLSYSLQSSKKIYVQLIDLKFFGCLKSVYSEKIKIYVQLWTPTGFAGQIMQDFSEFYKNISTAFEFCFLSFV